MANETLEKYGSHHAFRLKTGKTALAILNAIVDAGGKHSKRALVGLGERDRFAIHRGVQVLLNLQLVTVDGDKIKLRRNWAKRLDPLPELMPLTEDEILEALTFKPGELEAWFENSKRELEKFWAECQSYD